MITLRSADVTGSEVAWFAPICNGDCRHLGVLDPDYKFTDKYGLRWMAPNETAYPATFIVAEGGEIAYAEISDSHGGRIEAKDALAAAADRAANSPSLSGRGNLSQLSRKWGKNLT